MQVQENTLVDNNLILRSLVNESERRKAGGQFKHQGDNQAALIRKGDGPVDSFDGLTEMLSEADDSEVIHEASYHGKDHEKMVVLRMQVPSSYVVQLVSVHLEDVLPAHRVSQPPPYVNVKRHKEEYSLVATVKEPLRSDRRFLHLTEKEVQAKYGWVTFFIRKEDFSLQGWIPGISSHTSVCEGLGKQMVYLRVDRAQQQQQKPPQQAKQNVPQSVRLTLGDIL